MYLDASPKIHSRKFISGSCPPETPVFTLGQTMCFEIFRKITMEKNYTHLKKKNKNNLRIRYRVSIMQNAPSELRWSLSAPCIQSTLCQSLIWLFCSNRTRNASIFLPIRCHDNTEHWTHTHPRWKVIKAGNLLCSHFLKSITQEE